MNSLTISLTFFSTNCPYTDVHIYKKEILNSLEFFRVHCHYFIKFCHEQFNHFSDFLFYQLSIYRALSKFNVCYSAGHDFIYIREQEFLNLLYICRKITL